MRSSFRGELNNQNWENLQKRTKGMLRLYPRMREKESIHQHPIHMTRECRSVSLRAVLKLGGKQSKSSLMILSVINPIIQHTQIAGQKLLDFSSSPSRYQVWINYPPDLLSMTKFHEIVRFFFHSNHGFGIGIKHQTDHTKHLEHNRDGIYCRDS